MRGLLLALLIWFTLSPVPVYAQDDGNECDGLPCGEINWIIPLPPSLNSPTPIPTIEIVPTNTPEETGETSTPTATPTPTATIEPEVTIDFSDIEDQFATIEAIFEETPEVLNDFDDEPFEIDNSEISSNLGNLIGLMRGLDPSQFGVLTPLFNFAIYSFLFVFFIKIQQYMLPIIAMMFGLLRKLVDFVLSFIPGL